MWETLDKMIVNLPINFAGWLDNSATWTGLMPYLQDDYYLLCPDLPGITAIFPASPYWAKISTRPRIELPSREVLKLSLDGCKSKRFVLASH